MALLLGTTEGYRIYYTDEDGSLSVLQYTRGSTDDGRWSYGYHVNQRPTEGRPSIQAGFVNPDRITVISSNIDNADSAAVQVCTSREDDWLISEYHFHVDISTELPLCSADDHVETFPSETYVMNMEGDDTHRGPFTGPMTNETEPDADLITPTTSSELVSYSSDETRLGIAFGAPAVRSVFYIGTDAALRQVQEVNGTWTPVGPATDQRRWPLADRPNPDFAVAHDSNRDNIWIYYYVGNDNDTDTDAGAGAGRQLTQVHQSASGVWEPAVALPASNDTAAAGEEPGPQAGDPGSDGGDDGGGLSGAGKVGVGVGVGLGLPLVAALVAAYVFVHARRSRRDRDAELAAAHAAAAGPGGAPPSFAGSPAPGYTSGYWGSSVSGEGGGGGGGGGGGYWANGQWVPADPQQQQHQSLLFSSKPENSQWQAQDPRLSQYSAVNSRGGSPPPAPAQPPVFHEMLHQEPAYEVAGDGQVPEMPVSQAAPTPRAVSPASVVGIQPRS